MSLQGTTIDYRVAIAVLKARAASAWETGDEETHNALLRVVADLRKVCP